MNLVPQPMVMSYGPNDPNFPRLDRSFPEEKILRIRGENPVSSLILKAPHAPGRQDAGAHAPTGVRRGGHRPGTPSC